MKIKRIIFAALFAELLSFGFTQTRPVATDINTIPPENGKIKIRQRRGEKKKRKNKKKK